MPDVTYYFNAYTVGVWTLPDNIVDGDIGTFGYTNAKKTAQTLTGNNCPGTDLGTITKVEIRRFAYGDGDDRIDITPVFTGGNGETHPTTPGTGPPGKWSPYIDITNDPNHPDWSLWSHIQTLDCIINSAPVAKGNTLYCAKVEIRVTTAWEPPISDIDVGSPPIDRPTSTAYDRTYVNKNNPANASGVLHTIQIYAAASMTGLRVGTFYATNGDTLKCRDSVLIGDVEAGSTRTFNGLSLTVVAGDYIGCYFATGFIEESASGYDGVWRIDGEYIDPNDEAEYTFGAGWAHSIYGYGDIEADIDVGADPIDRTTAAGSGFTRISKDNPANASGTLHTVKVWAEEQDIIGLIVGTFYLTNGNTLKCRDSELVGDVVAGAERTFTGLSINVQEGDYIGCYFTEGFIEYDTSGFAGVWYISGEYIDPGDEETYGFLDGDAFSLYGYGDIEAPPVGQPYISRVQRIAGMKTIGVNL